MKPTLLLAGLMAIAAVLVNLVVTTAHASISDEALGVLVGLAFGQLALVALWTALGRTDWLFRFLGLLAAAAVVARPLSRVTATSWPEWIVVLSLFGVAVGLPVFLAACMGLAVTNPISTDPHCATSRQLALSQYSLRGMLSLMTAIAVLLGVGRYLAFPWQHLVPVVGCGACLALIAVTCLWALTSRTPVFLRWTVLAGLCVLSGTVLPGVESAHDAWFFTLVTLIEAIIVCWGLTVLQGAGWQTRTAARRPVTLRIGCSSSEPT